MKIFKVLQALAQTILDAIRGPFLEETKDLGKDMISIAQGKTKKEIELEKEIKKQKLILQAQEKAKKELEHTN